MIRVLFDTNVFVAALISDAGAPAELIALWQRGEFDIVVSPLLLAELERVLRRPRLRRWIAKEDVRQLLEILGRSCPLVADPPKAASVCRDPHDDYLFAVALAGRCQAVVSGDDDLLSVASPPVPVVSPRAMVDLLAR